MRFRYLALTILLPTLFGSLSAVSDAQSITYTEQSTASGTLGANSFTNANVLLTLVSDAANVTGGNGFFTTFGTGTVTVEGVGTATFTSPTLNIFDNQTFSNGGITGVAGIGDRNLGTLLGTFGNALATYDLRTSIGPITGSSIRGTDPITGNGVTFETTAGGLMLNSAGSSTFTARTTTVPEPGSIALLITSVLTGAGFLARHRKNAHKVA